MATATVSEKGWVVIPAEYRRRHHIVPGQKVEIVDYGESIGIIPSLDKPVLKARGVLGGDKSLTEALLEERKEQRQRENDR